MHLPCTVRRDARGRQCYAQIGNMYFMGRLDVRASALRTCSSRLNTAEARPSRACDVSSRTRSIYTSVAMLSFSHRLGVTTTWPRLRSACIFGSAPSRVLARVNASIITYSRRAIKCTYARLFVRSYEPEFLSFCTSNYVAGRFAISASILR